VGGGVTGGGVDTTDATDPPPQPLSNNSAPLNIAAVAATRKADREHKLFMAEDIDIHREHLTGTPLHLIYANVHDPHQLKIPGSGSGFPRFGESRHRVIFLRNIVQALR
jgi:hypothetical protein